MGQNLGSEEGLRGNVSGGDTIVGALQADLEHLEIAERQEHDLLGAGHNEGSNFRGIDVHRLMGKNKGPRE